MKSLFLMTAALLSVNAYASSAKIVATDSSNKKVTIAQDAKGTPRVDGIAKRYPTIKDFEEDTQFSNYCYVGAAKDVKELLEALVSAANGDGDSWAELVSIKTDVKSVYTVVANLTNEGGENELVVKIKPCKQ